MFLCGRRNLQLIAGCRGERGDDWVQDCTLFRVLCRRQGEVLWVSQLSNKKEIWYYIKKKTNTKQKYERMLLYFIQDYFWSIEDCLLDKIIYINIYMINKKQREQPFHVRRIRLKQSIIKSSQMLQHLSSSSHNIRKFRPITEAVCEEQESSQMKRKHTFNSSMVNQIDLLNLKIDKSQFNQIKYAIKMTKNDRCKKTQIQMQQNGLQAIKIQAKPSIKKIFNPKEFYQRKIGKQSHVQQRRPKLRLETLRSSASPDQSYKNKSIARYNIDHSASISKNGETNRKTINDGQTNRTIELQKIHLEPSKNRKKKIYLYEKLTANQGKQRDRSNLVYQKRIKSYTDFIWKLLIAHNVFIDLDLSYRWNQARLKAYVGPGNNCNMIKGLLKRRFWWAVSDQYTEDCHFIWSQLKISKIYQRQELTYQNPIKIIQSQRQKDLEISLLTKSSRNLSYNILKSIKKSDRDKFNKLYLQNKKIWNQNDCSLLQKHFFEDNYINHQNQEQQSNLKQINYKEQTKKISQKCKNITFIDISSVFWQQREIEDESYYSIKPIVHNHLENNFLLGNKKALFYNLRQYYERIGQDLFKYIPLTFHIKTGFKDPQYKKFTNYYNQIKQLNKESLDKQKNIWIVKPGQNSNRGNGIVVIDQIYEFDNIIKNTDKKHKISSLQQQGNQAKSSPTFIIQKYIQKPFLYYERKFDIRHYMLITNLYGVTRAYWYDEGYIRTSSYPFNVDNFQPQIHLTNDAVQKDYVQYGKFEPFNKISYNQFQNYLNLFPDKKLNFRQQILPQMKKMARDAAKSVYVNISPKQQMHNFEIFGLDFMIDKKFKPWLIQINTNPCLDCSSPLLNRIIPYMVQQSLKLSLDLIYPPTSHYPGLWKHNAPLVDLQTFKYELIFDSLSEGESLRRLYSTQVGYKCNPTDIGQIESDQCFRDDGKEIKLQDFT